MSMAKCFSFLNSFCFEFQSL